MNTRSGISIADPFESVVVEPYIPPGQEVSMLPNGVADLVAPMRPTPEVPQEQMLDESIPTTDGGLPPIMASDRVPSTATPPIVPPSPVPGVADEQAPVAGAEGLGNGRDDGRGGGQGRNPNLRISAPRFRQDQRYTNEDFYGRPRPNMSWQDPRGGNMVVPAAGQLALGIWAGRMQEGQRELADVRNKIAKLQSPDVQPTADPYQESFTEFVKEMDDSFIGALAEQYGSEDEAWLQMAKSPALQAQWEQMHKQAEALGQYGKFLWSDAKTIIEAAADNEIDMDPETLKLAEEFYYGMGSMRGSDGPASIHKLTKAGQAFRRAISREKLVRQDLLPNIEDRYRQWAEAKMYRDKATGKNVTEITSRYDANAFLEEQAKQNLRLYPDSTYEEELAYLKRVIPAEKMKLAVTSSNPPRPKSSSSSGGGDKKGGVPMVRVNYRAATTAQPDGTVKAGEQTLHLSPTQITGDKEHGVKEMQVSIDGASDTRPMRDVQLVYAPISKEWRLYGSMLDEGAISRINEIENSQEYQIPDGATGDEIAAIVSKKKAATEGVWSKMSKRRSAPVDGNTGVTGMHWGDNDPNAVVSRLLKDKGHDIAPDQVAELMTTKGGRDDIARKLGALSSSQRKEAPGIKDDVPQKSSGAGMVTMKMPNGTTGKIPADKVEAFKKKYPGASEVN